MPRPKATVHMRVTVFWHQFKERLPQACCGQVPRSPPAPGAPRRHSGLSPASRLREPRQTSTRSRLYPVGPFISNRPGLERPKFRLPDTGVGKDGAPRATRCSRGRTPEAPPERPELPTVPLRPVSHSLRSPGAEPPTQACPHRVPPPGQAFGGRPSSLGIPAPGLDRRQRWPHVTDTKAKPCCSWVALHWRRARPFPHRLSSSQPAIPVKSLFRLPPASATTPATATARAPALPVNSGVPHSA